jgi:hypothetical protein
MSIRLTYRPCRYQTKAQGLKLKTMADTVSTLLSLQESAKLYSSDSMLHVIGLEGRVDLDGLDLDRIDVLCGLDRFLLLLERQWLYSTQSGKYRVINHSSLDLD